MAAMEFWYDEGDNTMRSHDAYDTLILRPSSCCFADLSWRDGYSIHGDGVYSRPYIHSCSNLFGCLHQMVREASSKQLMDSLEVIFRWIKTSRIVTRSMMDPLNALLESMAWCPQWRYFVTGLRCFIQKPKEEWTSKLDSERYFVLLLLQRSGTRTFPPKH